ncbi:hypothetical protein JW930_05955 [Candidatus Woesearchaeota archaeon]|nr:hypothetical protein [Candidatus Woesearchaeota archaeon]
MSGIFAITSLEDCLLPGYYGTDYLSHLGTRYGGIAVVRDGTVTKSIRSISSSQFKAALRAKLIELRSDSLIHTALGVISDGEPQPLTYFSIWGDVAIATAGKINNLEELAIELLKRGNPVQTQVSDDTIGTQGVDTPNQTDIVYQLICQKSAIEQGIEYMRSKIKGAITLVMIVNGSEGSSVWAAADEYGNSPLHLARNKQGRCIATSTTPFNNLGYNYFRILAPGEIIHFTATNLEENIGKLADPGKSEPCPFMDIYTDFPAAIGSFGFTAEEYRYRAGEILASRDRANVDAVCGVPDSGIAYAYGYLNGKIHLLKRAFKEQRDHTLILQEIPDIYRLVVKYTAGWGRSYQPPTQERRDLVGAMKIIPLPEYIKGRKVILFEDSIVRGTQLRQLLEDKILRYGPQEVHIRVGSPILIDDCPFNRSIKNRRELLAWRGIAQLEGIALEDDHLPDINLIYQVPREVILEYADPSSERYRKLVDWMRDDLGVTSLMFLHPEELLSITGRESHQICRHCFGFESQRHYM